MKYDNGHIDLVVLHDFFFPRVYFEFGILKVVLWS